MTRADRNAIAGAEIPEVKVPDFGEILWGLFWKLRSFKDRDDPLAPRDLVDMSGLVRLGPLRVDIMTVPIIFSMDRAYSRAIQEEIANNSRLKKAQEG
jgi:hypothetical protein